jgi:6,7-dimethyl-8-ribityllumazine synthase
MLRKNRSSKSSSSARASRIAIVCAEYNPEFTEPLLSGTEQELRAAGVRPKNITLIRVPGSFEIPVVAACLARSGQIDVVVALGVVLQGETLHAKHILEATAHHLQKIAVETGVPVVDQIISPASKADARKRTWPGPYHRGVEAARTAVRMAALARRWGPKGLRP